jgi:molybdopterin adenylyltransferase
MGESNIKAAVVTISDTRQISDDLSGAAIVESLTTFGAIIVERMIVTDDPIPLEESLRDLCQRGDIDLILTTGGTGFGPRDNTPEATLAMIDREAPGIAEAIRRETASKTPLAMLSRGVCGISGSTLIINFPGSPKAVRECFEVIAPVLKHAVALINGEKPH